MSHESISAQSFFENLTWGDLGDQIAKALQHPGQAVPRTIQCPAVRTLYQIINQRVVESAVNRPGESIQGRELFNLDQCLAMARILEAMISLVEEGLSPRAQELEKKQLKLTDF
jgi:hypothetical protein